jgi:hypothetical protein
MATRIRRVVVLKAIPRISHVQASSGGMPSTQTAGTEMTPAIKTVAVTAALESERDRAAAFQLAWVIALNSADRKGRRSNSAQLD